MGEVNFIRDNSRILLREKNRLKLFFYWDSRTLEQIILMVLEWGVEKGLDKDDLTCLRLLLEDFSENIAARHAVSEASTIPLVFVLELAMTGKNRPQFASTRRADGASDLSVTLQFNGSPCNPLTEHDLKNTALLTGPGISLLDLFTTRRSYTRHKGFNIVNMVLPLGNAPQVPPVSDSVSLPEGREGPGLLHQIRYLWKNSLTFRHTAMFFGCAVFLIWLGLGFYYLTIQRSRLTNAESLSLQAMLPQKAMGADYTWRIESASVSLLNLLAESEKAEILLTDSDAMQEELKYGELGRQIPVHLPVLGIFIGSFGEPGACYYSLQTRERIPIRILDGEGNDIIFPGSRGMRTWYGPLFICPNVASENFASLAYIHDVGVTIGDKKFYMGALLDSTWIARGMRALSGLPQTWPLLWNRKGEYIFYPPGQEPGRGPQSLRQDALAHNLPQLAELAAAAGQGHSGVIRIEDVSGSGVWPVPWQDGTSLVFTPLREAECYLGMLVSHSVIGATPLTVPGWLVFMALTGPLFVGAVCWWATARTLRPLGELATALEQFSRGELDQPLPAPHSKDEAGQLLAAFEQTRILLKASLHNLLEATSAEDKMHGELHLARMIQESMLPAYPMTRTRLDGVEIGALLLMAREVCGDLYDVFSSGRRPGKICCLVGDVCGKGIPASLLMSVSMSLAKSALLGGASPAEALAMINRALLRNDTSNVFVTMLIGILDVETGDFTWASAGHPPPIIGPEAAYGPCSAGAHMLPWSGELVLGVKPDICYTNFAFTLKTGQTVFLYSDGAAEAMGPAAPDRENLLGNKLAMFGEGRLVGALDDACRAVKNEGLGDDENVASVIVTKIQESLKAHMGGEPPHDDITLMVLRRERAG